MALKPSWNFHKVWNMKLRVSCTCINIFAFDQHCLQPSLVSHIPSPSLTFSLALLFLASHADENSLQQESARHCHVGGKNVKSLGCHNVEHCRIGLLGYHWVVRFMAPEEIPCVVFSCEREHQGGGEGAPDFRQNTCQIFHGISSGGSCLNDGRSGRRTVDSLSEVSLWKLLSTKLDLNLLVAFCALCFSSLQVKRFVRITTRWKVFWRASGIFPF